MRKFLLTQFLLCLFAIPLLAQDRVINGKITSSEDGASLPGVNITIKGTTRGVTSDADGNYSLSVPTTASSLVFSFIGYVKQEITIGNKNVVNVLMAADASTLQEFVVTAQGIRKSPRELGYAVSSVKTEDVTVGRSP